MTMFAIYYAVDNNQINYLKELSLNNYQPPKKSWISSFLGIFSKAKSQKTNMVSELLSELTEKSYADKYYVELDSRWDWLHYVLTGFNGDDKHNTNKTPEQFALYYAFFGKEVPFIDEDFSWVGSDEIFNIVQALTKIDIDKKLAMVDFKKFNQIDLDLYPDIWESDDYQELRIELKQYFENFKQFYQNALKENKSVLVLIC